MEVIMGLLDQAVQNHTMWRIKLLSAMDGGSKWDVHSCGSETQCDLGKWLEREEAATTRTPPELANLKQAHTQFHQCVSEVAMQLERQEWSDARQSIFQGAFHQGMVRFLQAIDALKGTQKRDKSKAVSWTKARQDWEAKPSKPFLAPIKAQRA
jgi:Chemoreceptor zinc-binding domain